MPMSLNPTCAHATRHARLAGNAGSAGLQHAKKQQAPPAALHPCQALEMLWMVLPPQAQALAALAPHCGPLPALLPVFGCCWRILRLLVWRRRLRLWSCSKHGILAVQLHVGSAAGGRPHDLKPFLSPSRAAWLWPWCGRWWWYGRTPMLEPSEG